MEGYYHLQPSARPDPGKVVPVLAGAGVDDVVVRVLDRREHRVMVVGKRRPSVDDVSPALVLQSYAPSQRVLDLCLGRFMGHTCFSDRVGRTGQCSRLCLQPECRG